jgi:cyanophycinase-like exopeptidase
LFKLFATELGQLTDRKLDPGTLLGIGIDERTAIIVRQDQLEVVGAGHAYVFNPREWKNGVAPFFLTLSAGDRYDVRKRLRLKPVGRRSTSP